MFTSSSRISDGDESLGSMGGSVLVQSSVTNGPNTNR